MYKDAYKEMFHGWIAKAAEYKIAIGIAAACTVIILVSLIWPAPPPQTPINEVRITPPPAHVYTPPATPTPPPVPKPATPPPPNPMEKELSAKPLFPATPKPAPKPAAPKPQAAPKPTPAPAPKPAVAPTSKPAAPVATNAPAGYYIQVGTFKDKQHAIALSGKLEYKSWPSLVVARPGGMHAVWVGPYKTRDDVDQAKSALKKDTGLPGFVKRSP
jgi:cell division protein FtsN